MQFERPRESVFMVLSGPGFLSCLLTLFNWTKTDTRMGCYYNRVCLNLFVPFPTAT